MSVPIRIVYRETAEGFAEAQKEAAAFMPASSPRPLWSPATGNKIWIGILVVIFIGVGVQEFWKGTELKILLPSLVGVAVIMALWLWFFKKIGLDRTEPPVQTPPDEQADRERWIELYRKKTGGDVTNVTCEFSEEGFRTIAENGRETARPWTSIAQVVDGKNGVLLFSRRRYFGLIRMYHWYPKTAFASETDYAETIRMARAKVPDFTKVD